RTPRDLGVLPTRGGGSAPGIGCPKRSPGPRCAAQTSLPSSPLPTAPLRLGLPQCRALGTPPAPSRLLGATQTCAGWPAGARPDPTGTFTLPETPSFSWRDNAGLQA